MQFVRFAMLGAALAATPAAASDYAAAKTEICGYLPYRAAGEARFANERLPQEPATIGVQATYSFAWDLARPAFLASEVAEDLLEGMSVEQARASHGGALSLGEYMLHAASQFDAAPAVEPTEDFRMRLAAERPQTFHEIYVHSKAAYEAVVEELDPDSAPDPARLQEIAKAWRPAYAMLAKAQADDKRIELLASGLDAEMVLEKEAEACLAHGVRLAALGDADGIALAKAAVARWEKRPEVSARSLPRAARSAFFDREDFGDETAAAVAALPAGAVSLDAFRPIASAYAKFVTASKSLHEATRQQ